MGPGRSVPLDSAQCDTGSQRLLYGIGKKKQNESSGESRYQNADAKHIIKCIIS
jgi:hypothetical protein